jgi:amicyanin
MKRLIPYFAVLVLPVLAFGILKAGQPPTAAVEQNSGGGSEVKIDNFSFAPPSLTVPVGTRVTWTNQDDVPHTVVSTEGKVLKSPVLDTDQKFSYTFTAAGTYLYYCSVHPKMTGKVVVQ